MALPALSASNWELDGIAFNMGDDVNGFSYAVKTSKGWVGPPPRRPDHTNRPDTNGSYRGPNYQGSRVIELEGIAQCARRVDRELLADTLAGLCRDANVLYALSRTEYGRTLRAYVEMYDADVREMPDGVSLFFNLQLIASDPRKYSTTFKVGTTGIAQAALDGVQWDGPALPATGVEWDGPALPITGVVWQASSGVSGVLELDNDGTAPTPVLFTITAPVVGTLINPTITDTGRGYVITYGGTMVPGDILTIDTSTGLIQMNGTSAAGQLSRADLFEIPARSSVVIQFSASGPADTAQLTATWADAY